MLGIRYSSFGKGVIYIERDPGAYSTARMIIAFCSSGPSPVAIVS